MMKINLLSAASAGSSMRLAWLIVAGRSSVLLPIMTINWATMETSVRL